MTKALIYKNGENYIGAKISEHAGFAKSGKDIVCAAVSSLVINTINSIDQFTDDEMMVNTDEKSAIIEFRLSGTPSNDSLLLVKSLVLGLREIEKKYKKYFDVKIMEV